MRHWRHWRLSNATIQCRQRQLCDAGRSRAAVISDPTPFTCLRSTLVCRKFPDRDIFQLRPFTRHCCGQGGRVGLMNDTLHHARGDLLPEQIRLFQAMSVVKIEQSLREALEQMQCFPACSWLFGLLEIASLHLKLCFLCVSRSLKTRAVDMLREVILLSRSDMQLGLLIRACVLRLDNRSIPSYQPKCPSPTARYDSAFFFLGLALRAFPSEFK